MAKVDVKVIDMVAGEVKKVSCGGAEYERAEHPIKETDLILNVSDYSTDLTVDAFYKVILTDDDEDAKFYDDIDDSRYRDAYDEDFVPFRKVAAPSLEARVDKLESDVAALKGEQEAEEKPKFKAGDKVRGKLSGCIYTLLSRYPEKDNAGYGLAWQTEGYGDDDWIGENQVELVEEKPLAVGDYAKVVPHNNDIGFGGSPGDIVIIRDVRSDRFRTEELSGGDYSGNPWVKTEGLVRATDEEVAEAKAAHFEVGDYIVPLPSAEKYCITNSGMLLGKVVGGRTWGTRIEIVAHEKKEEVGEVYTAGGKDFRKATDEEIAEAKAAMKPIFNVGDYAKVVGRTYNDDFKSGTIVKITNEADEDGDYKIELLDGSDHDYAKASALEKVDAEKAETIDKWVKIGREVNEFKKGDVIKTREDDSTTGLKGGTIAVVVDVDDDGDVFLNVENKIGDNAFNYAHEVELVAPVESRVDQ